MATSPNDVRVQVIMKIQEELDMEVTLEGEMLNLFTRLLEKIRLRRSEIIRLGSQPNNPLVGHGRELLERLTGADMQNAMQMMGARHELQRIMAEKIRSFLRYMGPLIIIDGAHLKGNYLGTNLLAVGMDGNNQVIPLATGVSRGEMGESWTWFLSKLKEQIGEPPNLCIILDRHAAIIQACGIVFDNSFHGFCDRHLMMNCNLKGKKLCGIFWKACKSYTTEDFDKAISELRGHRLKVVTKLEEAGFENGLGHIALEVVTTT
nr:transposase, MuDR, MULE transposase domain protein [Tanacetum cinerariifolium]